MFKGSVDKIVIRFFDLINASFTFLLKCKIIISS